jgi:hypothetical protein
MASDLWSIFLNVVATFVYAGIVWLWQKSEGRPISVAPRPQPSQAESEVALDDHRAHNRHAVERVAHKFLFYLVTFGMLYISVTMPPLFKALFSKGEVLLSQARFIGEYLAPVPVGNYYLQIAFFLIAAALYLPLLALSEAITSMLYPLIDSFHQVTYRIWSAVMMFVFLLFCIPVAATSIWLFYEKTFRDALLTVLLALFLAFAFGQAQSGRR